MCPCFLFISPHLIKGYDEWHSERAKEGCNTINCTGFLGVVAENQCHLRDSGDRRASGGKKADHRNGFAIFCPTGKTAKFDDHQEEKQMR